MVQYVDRGVVQPNFVDDTYEGMIMGVFCYHLWVFRMIDVVPRP